MSTLGIVEPFNVAKHIRFGLVSSRVLIPIGAFIVISLMLQLQGYWQLFCYIIAFPGVFIGRNAIYVVVEALAGKALRTRV